MSCFQRLLLVTIAATFVLTVIGGTVLWRGADVTENPAPMAEDLKIPILERVHLKAILKDLHLLDPTFIETYQGGNLLNFVSPSPQERLTRYPHVTFTQKLAVLRAWCALSKSLFGRLGQDAIRSMESYEETGDRWNESFFH